MKIAIGNDHSAVELKNIIVDFLKEKGIEVLNLGTDSSESCDYPVYGEKVGRAVHSGDVPPPQRCQCTLLRRPRGRK